MEYCCGKRICLNPSLNEDESQDIDDVCMPVELHSFKNLSADGTEYCAYYCETNKYQCFDNTDCEEFGPGYCCGMVQNMYSYRLEGP